MGGRGTGSVWDSVNWRKSINAHPILPLPLPSQVQNCIDDIAMAFERLHAMVTGQDPLATALFFWRCLLLATGVCLGGWARGGVTFSLDR